jgi:hypothetical protein
MKKRNILYIGLLVMLCCLVTVRILICKYVPVTIVSIPKDIKYTNEYNPAAYTSVDGKIEGAYRIEGHTCGSKSLKEYISIHPTKGLIIGNKWYSNNGFQQHVLVRNYKERKFKDTRKRYRRALCDECDGSASYLIIESTYPMTLSNFAKEVSKYCYNAVNLDMGDYGYGWIGKSKHTRWARYNRNKQTSWIVCDKSDANR